MSAAKDVSSLVRLSVILSIATGAALVATAISITAAMSSQRVVIAVDAKGSVTPVVPLTETFVSESRIAGFAEECVRRAFSHDFLHFGQTIPVAQDCFTPEAADRYASAMQSYVKLMEQRRMVMGVTIPRPPRVVRVYQFNNMVHWDLQAEVEIFFEGRAERIPPSKNRIELTVRRVPLDDDPRGISIDKFSVGPAA
jgi:hypothetical protein